LFVIHVVLLLIVMFYVSFMCKYVLPPGVNPIAVDKYININCTKQRSSGSVTSADVGEVFRRNFGSERRQTADICDDTKPYGSVARLKRRVLSSLESERGYD
jgi:hypothetical protein